jgi:hypothetical protein
MHPPIDILFCGRLRLRRPDRSSVVGDVATPDQPQKRSGDNQANEKPSPWRHAGKARRRIKVIERHLLPPPLGRCSNWRQSNMIARTFIETKR